MELLANRGSMVIGQSWWARDLSYLLELKAYQMEELAVQRKIEIR